MDTESDFSGAGPKKPSGVKNKFRLILIIASAVILLLFFAVPVYLSSEAGKKLIVNKINSTVNGKVNMDDFSMGWFKGVQVSDLSFENPTGSTSVNIKELRTRPSYLGLLFGNVELTGTQVAGPEVKIGFEQDKESLDLYLSANEVSSRELKADKNGVSRISLAIKGGNAVVSPTDRKQEALLEFKNIAAKVDLKGAGNKSSFDVSMDVADSGKASKITAKGSLKPPKKKGWSLKGTSGDFTVKIDGLDLESLQPLFSLMGKEVDAGGKLDADIVAKIDDGRFEELKVKAVLSGLKKKIDGKAAVLDEPVKIDAQISSDRKDIKIDRLSVESSFCTLSCSGGTNSVDYEVTADLAGLQGFAAQFADFKDYKFAGSAVEKGTLSFGKGWIKAKGLASVENFAVSVNGKKAGSVLPVEMPFDIEVDTEKDVLKIALTKVSGDFGRIELTDPVIPLTEDSKSELGLKVSADLDLQKTQPFLELFFALPEGTTLAGQLNTDVSITRKRKDYHIVTDRTKVTDLKVGRKGQEPFEEKLLTVAVDMVCDPEEKTVTINGLQVKSSQINITKGRFSQSTKKGKTKLSGELVAEYDLAAISKLPVMPEGLLMMGKRCDSIKFESNYPEGQTDKMLANLNTKTKFGFDKAEYMGLEIGKVDADVEVKNGLLEISPFSAKVNNGTLNFAGSVDFNQKPALLKIPKPLHIVEKIDINDKTTDKLLKYVNPLFANSVNVRGIADFHCEQLSIPLAGTSKNDMVAVGTIAMNEVHLDSSNLLGQIMSLTGEKDPEITVLPSKFVLKDGFLSYDNMQVNIGRSPVNFRGRIGLNNTINMDVGLPYTFSGKKVRIDSSQSNRITLPIEGNLNNPRINTAKLLQKGAEQLLEEKAEEYLGEEGKRLLREIFK